MERLLPSVLVNLMPVACGDTCGPHGDEQVVGYRQTLCRGEPAGPRGVACTHAVAAELLEQSPTLLWCQGLRRFYDYGHLPSVPEVKVSRAE